MAAAPAVRQKLKITRIFDAPCSRLWRAWTAPELFKKWRGPKHFTSPFCSLDLSVGGKYLFSVRDTDGRDYWSTGVYLQIMPESKLVYTNSCADKDGKIVPPAHYGMSVNMPMEMVVTAAFEDVGGRTKMTLLQDGFPEGDGDAIGLARAGWQQSFDKLEELTTGIKHAEITAEPGKQELFVNHVFNASLAKVYKVYTDPAVIPGWWGPERLTTKIEKLELYPGGAWRFVQKDSDGKEYAFRGHYHEVLPGRRLVLTFESDVNPGHVALQTVTFEEHKGKTKITEQSVFQSVADRDNMMKAGMDEGVYEGSERFSRLLK